MAQYKGIKEILKKFWNTSRIWIKNNFTAKKLGKLEFHSTVAENGHTVINMGNDAVNIYIHKDGRYARFDKMPTEGSIQKNTDLFKVELFPDTCIIDSFGVSIDVSWNTISNDDADNDVIETLRNHINSIGNPHDTSVDNIIGLSVVGRTGNYNDLNNKPTIPEAQVQSDWEATEGIGVILNKPTLGTAATKNYTSSISNNSTDLPTAEAVYNFINSLGIENIITNIDNIEQQLSNIFTAENKATDLNTTTNSGIYYWTTDAANRPCDYGVLLVNKYSTWINQIAYGTNGSIYFRQKINDNNWTEWKAVAFDGEATAYKVANALTVNGKTYDGSSAVDAGVQTVANGGTGVTTQADINKAFVGELGVGESDVTDGTEFVSSYASDNGFADTNAVNTPYKRKFSAVWNYIKGKISSVLGLTKDRYGGTAAAILDYYNGSTPIKVRWSGAGINNAEWYPAFNADGTAIEPIHRGKIHAGKADTADKATSDANGNNIVNTYATKTELEKTTTKNASLSTVTTGTTKYIKLGTFNWSDSFSFRCRIAGNSFEDNVNINILGGHSRASSVCGYYSTNSMLIKSIIVKRGDAWNGNFEIYLKIVQLTTAIVFVTIDKDYQNRINISESTAAPSGTLEEIAFNKFNGMFSSNIDALCIKANNVMKIPTSAPSTKENGCIWIG